MSTMTLKKIRDYLLGKVAYYTDEKNQRAMQRHQQMADALSERIAADEAAVRRSPYVGGRFSSETPFDCPQCSGHGLLESGQACNLCDTTGFIKPPAQPPIDLAAIRETESRLASADALLRECDTFLVDMHTLPSRVSCIDSVLLLQKLREHLGTGNTEAT